MTTTNVAEQSLRDGDPVAALKYLQEQVRAKPADSKLRVFLFQLLAVTGQWERALNQLNVAAELDPAALAMAQMYREAIRCELLREQVEIERVRVVPVDALPCLVREMREVAVVAIHVQRDGRQRRHRRANVSREC